MARPDLSRIPEYFHVYVRQVKGDELPEVFKTQSAEFIPFLESIAPEKTGYRYAEGKWSMKEVLQHIIDTERIFAYRALCIARKDSTAFPGFDENAYTENSGADKRDWKDLVDELRWVRRSTELLFSSFNDEQLETSGTASGKSIYVRGIGFTIAGHVTHHITILKERYC
jgi:hypothetical protein